MKLSFFLPGVCVCVGNVCVLGGPCSEKDFCLVFPFAQFVRRCTDRLDTSSLPDLYLISHCTQYIKEQNMEMTAAQRFEHRSHFEELNVLLLWLHGSKKVP